VLKRTVKDDQRPRSSAQVPNKTDDELSDVPSLRCKFLARNIGISGLLSALFQNIPSDSLCNVLQNFVLSPDDLRCGQAREYLKSLRNWLATIAIALENGNLTMAANRLAISKPTLKNWLHKKTKTNQPY
jgi:hypothetical protein